MAALDKLKNKNAPQVSIALMRMKPRIEAQRCVDNSKGRSLFWA